MSRTTTWELWIVDCRSPQNSCRLDVASWSNWFTTTTPPPLIILLACYPIRIVEAWEIWNIWMTDNLCRRPIQNRRHWLVGRIDDHQTARRSWANQSGQVGAYGSDKILLISKQKSMSRVLPPMIGNSQLSLHAWRMAAGWLLHLHELAAECCCLSISQPDIVVVYCCNFCCCVLLYLHCCLFVDRRRRRRRRHHSSSSEAITSGHHQRPPKTPSIIVAL